MRLVCLGSLSCWKMNSPSGNSFLALDRILVASMVWYCLLSIVPSILHNSPTPKAEKHPHIIIFLSCLKDEYKYFGLNRSPLRRHTILLPFHCNWTKDSSENKTCCHFSIVQSLWSSAYVNLRFLWV